MQVLRSEEASLPPWADAPLKKLEEVRESWWQEGYVRPRERKPRPLSPPPRRLVALGAGLGRIKVFMPAERGSDG